MQRTEAYSNIHPCKKLLLSSRTLHSGVSKVNKENQGIYSFFLVLTQERNKESQGLR
jgi:hypothetical protein